MNTYHYSNDKIDNFEIKNRNAIYTYDNEIEDSIYDDNCYEIQLSENTKVLDMTKGTKVYNELNDKIKEVIKKIVDYNIDEEIYLEDDLIWFKENEGIEDLDEAKVKWFLWLQYNEKDMVFWDRDFEDRLNEEVRKAGYDLLIIWDRDEYSNNKHLSCLIVNPNKIINFKKIK